MSERGVSALSFRLRVEKRIRKAEEVSGRTERPQKAATVVVTIAMGCSFLLRDPIACAADRVGVGTAGAPGLRTNPHAWDPTGVPAAGDIAHRIDDQNEILLPFRLREADSTLRRHAGTGHAFRRHAGTGHAFAHGTGHAFGRSARMNAGLTGKGEDRPLRQGGHPGGRFCKQSPLAGSQPQDRQGVRVNPRTGKASGLGQARRRGSFRVSPRPNSLCLPPIVA